MWDGTSNIERSEQGIRYAGRSEPILRLGFRLSGSPWRLGPAWAVLAGALASQAPIWGGENLLRLGGSLLLADAVWGVFWRRSSLRQGGPSKRERGARLPYSNAHSPMLEALSRLGYEAIEDGEKAWQGMLAGLVAVAILSILLGSSAIVLSLLALIASVGVRLMVRRGKTPALMMAFLCTGLPWTLGAALGRTGNLLPPSGFSGVGLALGAAFTFLTWSLYRVDLNGSRGLVWPIWLGEVVVLVTMVALREPLGLAIVAALMVVPCLWISRRSHPAQEMGENLRNSDVWWLASMLVAALAVRF